MGLKRTALVVLFQEMSEMTQPKCGQCPVPNSCCSPEYCDIAQDYAKEKWGVDLQPAHYHPTLRYMGPTGCTVPPHLRPICTVHTCSINNLGYDPKDPEWTEKYFDLRNKIDDLLFQEDL